MSAEEMSNQALPQSPEVANRVVLLSAFGFLAFAAVAMAVLFMYYRTAIPRPLLAEPHPFPEPTLQISPQGDLDRFKGEQAAQLFGYGWVDRSRGLVRIPIEDAMRLVAGRGGGAYEAPDQPEAVPAPGSRGGAHP